MPKIAKPIVGATLTVDQAWEILGKDNITRQAIYLAIERREIPSVRLGRRILIPRHAFYQLFGVENFAADTRPAA